MSITVIESLQRRLNIATVLLGFMGLILTLSLLQVIKYKMDYNIHIVSKRYENYDECYYHKTIDNDTFEYLEDILESVRQPKIDKTIFFIVNTCKPNRILHLLAREACSIESAARQNPNRDIFVLFSSPVALPKHQYQYDRILSILDDYDNIFMRNLNISTYPMDSPIETMLKNGHYFRSTFRTDHLTDTMLRLMTLYKFGGIYIDMDYVILKSFDGLDLNFAGLQNKSRIGNGVLGFSQSGYGHEMIDLSLRYLNDHYLEDHLDIPFVDPQFLTTTFKQICYSNNTINYNVINKERCSVISIYPPSVFYPSDFELRRMFFNETSAKETFKFGNHSVGIHLGNKLTIGIKFRDGQKMTNHILAMNYCPRIFESCTGDDDFE